MDTKQMIAIFAVIAIAAAGIGAAYAYQAQLVSEENTVESHDLVLNHTGDFNKTFSTDKIQYDTLTTAQDTAVYTPAGAQEIYRGYKGVAINQNEARTAAVPYVIAIDSSIMESENWFTFYVKTVDMFDGSNKDMAGYYAIYFEYTPDNETTVYKDVIVLDNTKAKTVDGVTGLIPIFMSKSVALPAAQNVEIVLYAIEKTGTIGEVTPDYEIVEFQFFAITAYDTVAEFDAAATTDVTVTAYNKDQNLASSPTALEVDDYCLYYDDGARVCAGPSINDNVATFTIPTANPSSSTTHTACTADALLAGGYVFRTDDSSTAAAIALQEKLVSLDITGEFDKDDMTFVIGTATEDSIFYQIKNKCGLEAVYHTGVALADPWTGLEISDYGDITFDTESGVVDCDKGMYKITLTYNDGNTSATATQWVKIAEPTA